MLGQDPREIPSVDLEGKKRPKRKTPKATDEHYKLVSEDLVHEKRINMSRVKEADSPAGPFCLCGKHMLYPAESREQAEMAEEWDLLCRNCGERVHVR